MTLMQMLVAVSHLRLLQQPAPPQVWPALRHCSTGDGTHLPAAQTPPQHWLLTVQTSVSLRHASGVQKAEMFCEPVAWPGIQ